MTTALPRLASVRGHGRALERPIANCKNSAFTHTVTVRAAYQRSKRPPKARSSDTASVVPELAGVHCKPVTARFTFFTPERRESERVAGGRSSPHPGRKRQKRPEHGRTRPLPPCRTGFPCRDQLNHVSEALHRLHASGASAHAALRSRQSLLPGNGVASDRGKHLDSQRCVPQRIWDDQRTANRTRLRFRFLEVGGVPVELPYTPQRSPRPYQCPDRELPARGSPLDVAVWEPQKEDRRCRDTATVPPTSLRASVTPDSRPRGALLALDALHIHGRDGPAVRHTGNRPEGPSAADRLANRRRDPGSDVILEVTVRKADHKRLCGDGPPLSPLAHSRLPEMFERETRHSSRLLRLPRDTLKALDSSPLVVTRSPEPLRQVEREREALCPHLSSRFATQTVHGRSPTAGPSRRSATR